MGLDTAGFAYVPNSFSRELDMRVQSEEKPYGYVDSPPSADTGNFDQHAIESKKEYSPKKGN